MGLFWTDPPKRVTGKELTEGYSMKSSVLGRLTKRFGDTKGLNEDHIRIVKSIAEPYTQHRMDGAKFSGITKKNLPEVMNKIKETGHFTQNQMKQIETEFKKDI